MQTFKTLIVATIALFLFSFAGYSQDIAVSRDLAKVDQIRGFYVFTNATPAAKYKYLGTIDGAKIGMKSPQYDVVRDGLLKKLREEFPGADGAILQFNSGAKDKADAIKFE
jgi:hypothetical protein